jgi:uncharacterized protein YbaP (TraB family)
LLIENVDKKEILKKANVPEHSVTFMESMSGGKAFLVDSYLFYHADKLLMAIGYPLSGTYKSDVFYKALTKALDYTAATDCFAICPFLPRQLRVYQKDLCQYFTLSSNQQIPSRLERLAERAALTLRVEEGNEFTLAHQRLWAEFVGRTPLTANVRRLYERTQKVVNPDSNLILLNAWDTNGNLAASLLLDLNPQKFLSYILGAHSRIHYTPYASDLLFSKMLTIAKREGKEYIHLGLGVNDGIRRFKKKWGGTATMSYEMAAWHDSSKLSAKETFQMLYSPPDNSLSKQKYIEEAAKNKKFNMLWEIERNGRRSWIGGTAHFFRYSFEASLRKLFDQVDTVIFEGPLDQVSMDIVAETGKNPPSDFRPLINALSEKEIRKLERVVCGPQGWWAKMLQLEYADPLDVRYYLSQTRHWFAFFSLWSGFLRRKGWHGSVDMEAWYIAREMDKKIVGMETIQEQIETLENIPYQRVVRFFQECQNWYRNIRQHEKAYLKGDLQGMMGTTAEFPTRTKTVINKRDEIFLQRMLPYITDGKCAVFVGSAHMLNLEHMIADAGFKIKKV